MGATCPAAMKATSNGWWQGDNPLDYAVPLLILQICIVVILTRFLAFLLRPLRQPRVIAEIIGGILLGPSALGRNKNFLATIFPSRSLTVLDTVANIGLLFFLFLVGLELDLRSLHQTGKSSLFIALSGISLPFLLGIAISFLLRSSVNKGVSFGPFLVFMGVSLSITAFPVLARILAELKLLTTDLGRIAMSAAAVNDIAAWILLALAIALSGSGSPIVSLWVLLTAVAFVLVMFFCVRPVFNLMARRSPEGEPVREIYICMTFVTVLAASFATDAIGIHALFGAFVTGIIMPKEGPFAGLLIEKIEDLVSGLFLPLYFVSSGLKTNVATIHGGQSWALLALVIATACFGKIAGTIIVSLAVKVPLREAVTLGFLMNTKGLVELIVLNIGKDRKVLNDETFAILVLMALFTTFITTPIVTAVYKPARRSAHAYKHRTVARKDKETELRVLACFHGTRNIPTMINLLESSRGTRRHGMVVYAMHLMEMSERSSAISMVQKARHNGLPFWNKKTTTADRVIVAFQAYQQLSNVTVRPMTAISDLNTIHEDIIASARTKRAAIIILPFHKVLGLDRTMESVGNAYQQVNQRVVSSAPCSVGILVDRGLGGTCQVHASEVSYSVYVLFFGGPDDREALAYGARMAEHPGIEVTVVDFSANELDNAEEIKKMKYQKQSVEHVVEVVKEIRCSLILVGRTSMAAALTSVLAESRSECTELGKVGSYLAMANVTSASVMVIKTYDTKADTAENATEDPEDVSDTGCE